MALEALVFPATREKAIAMLLKFKDDYDTQAEKQEEQ